MAFRIPFTFKLYSPVEDNVSTHTNVYWETSGDTQYTYGVFFEIVSPLLNLKDQEILVQRFWDEFKQKYIAGHKFDESLEAAFLKLQQELETLGLTEGIDANIVVFSTEPIEKQVKTPEDEARLLKIAVVGAVDIFLIRDTKYSNLMEYLDVNTDISKIEYNELDIKYGDLLLIANKGVLQNLFFSGMLDVRSIEHILLSLEEQRNNIGGGKRVFAVLFAELDLEGLKYKTFDGFRQKSRSIGSIFSRGIHNLKDKVNVLGYLRPLFNKVLGSKPFWPSSGGAGGIADFREEQLKGYRRGEAQSTSQYPSAGEASPVTSGAVSEEIVVVPATSQGGTSIKGASAKDVSVSSDSGTGGTASLTGRETTPVMDGAAQVYDPISYLRNRRSPSFKLRNSLQRVAGILKRLVGYGRGATPSVVSHKIGRMPGGTIAPVLFGKSRRSGMKQVNIYAYLAAGIVLLVFVFVRVRKARLNRYDTQLIEEFKQKYYAPLHDVYENRVKRLLAGDPQGDIQRCFDYYESLKQAFDSYKVNLKLKTSTPQLEAYYQEAQDIRARCEDKYYSVYNIQRLKMDDLRLAKDFKVALGEQSNVVSVDIYQGVIMLLDAGKGAVYKLNQENSAITRIEVTNLGDIQGELKSIAIGTETFFVCAGQYGVYYYRQASKELRALAGTDVANLGGGCNNIDTYAKNVYIVTELGDGIYKVAGLGGLQYATPNKYVNYAQARILDLAIDGSIYALVSTDDGRYEVLRFYGGKYDSAFKLEDDFKDRLRDPALIYTNPSGYMPIYIYDRGGDLIYVVEKPTKEKHPGVGKLVATYKLPKDLGEVKDIAVLLSVHDNTEKGVYILTVDGRLYMYELQ